MLDQIIATALIVLITTLVVIWVGHNGFGLSDRVAWILGFFGLMVPFFVFVIGLLIRVWV